MGTLQVMPWIAIAVLCSGCSAYRAGSVASEPSQFRRFECLDLAVDAYQDDSAAARVEASELVAFEFRFGNVCRDPTPLRLDRVRVRVEGMDQTLSPFDPDGVIVGGVLDGGRSGSEVLGFERPPLAPTSFRLCVDVSQVGERPEREDPICVAWPPTRD